MTARILSRTLAAIAGALFAATTAASPVGFDNSFGSDGKVYANLAFGTSNDVAQAVALQPNGAMVVAGTCHTGFTRDFCLARFLANGDLDPSFGNGGKVVTAIGLGDDVARAMVLDGSRIVVAGSCTQGGEVNFCVARYLSNGALDTSFNGTGTVNTPVGLLADEAYAVAMDGNRILVAGSCEVSGVTDSCVVRLLDNGALDTSYGSGGKVILPLGDSQDGIRGLAVLAGKAVVASRCLQSSFGKFCVARLDANGSLDAGFGVGGVVVTQITPQNGVQRFDNPNAVAIMSDGGIAIGGECRDATFNYHMCVQVLNTDGSPSTWFGGSGQLILSIPATSASSATALATIGTSALYVSGPCTESGVQRFCVAALNVLGLSATFNGGQPVVDTLNIAGDAIPMAMAAVFNGITLDTDIAVAGACGGDFCAVRYQQTGTRITSFGVLGVKLQEMNLGRLTDVSESLVRQPDGRIVAAGTCATRACMARFNADGTLDTTFAAGGIYLDAPNTSRGLGSRMAMDGTTIVHVTQSNTGMRITRLLDNGAPDPAWGAGTGVVVPVLTTGLFAGHVAGVAVIGGGSLLIGFACETGPFSNDFCVAKLTPAGALDTTFNAGGVTPGLRQESFGTNDVAASMTMDGSSIVVAGTCGTAVKNPCVMRLTSAGIPDTTFNGTGKRTLPLGIANASFLAVSVSAGKTTLGGGCTPSVKEDFCVTRLNANGSLDTTFNGTGTATLSMGLFASRVEALVADGTGVVAAGSCDNDGAGLARDLCLARFREDGIIDIDFNGTGLLRSQLAMGALAQTVTDMVRDGARFVASMGNCLPDNGDGFSDFCVAAYLQLPASLPGAPFITGVIAGDTTATVSFVPPASNGGSSITSYTATCGTQSATGASSPLVVTGLLNGVTVGCSVTATNSAGTGPGSDPPVSVRPVRAAIVTLTASVNPSSATGVVSFFASIAGQGPTGSVEFRLAGGQLVPGCSLPVVVSSGVATCFSNTFSTPGTFSITAHYSGDGANAPAISNTLSHTVIATFEQLSVTKLGAGSATVTSAPGGIDCGATCTAQFATNASVTLTAVPAIGTVVQSWTGCTVMSGNDCVMFMAVPRAVQVTLLLQQYAVTVSKAGGGSGAVTSSPAGIDCGATCVANYGAGSVVTLSASAAAGSTFTGWSGACTGMAACVVTLDGAKAAIATFTLSPLPPNPPRLGNISTRGQVLTGNDVMIGGFVIGGSANKTVVVRARGPSLVPFGITNALANPTLQLFLGQNAIATNDDFGTAPNLAALQASGFAPDNPLESAILANLAPGAYTAIVSGVGGGTGVGIIEVFEVDQFTTPLVNISTRGKVLTGNDVMIGGFVIQGSGPQAVVVRARGPSLVPFGITNALANPALQLVRSSDQATLATNDDWGSASNAAAVTASGFAPSEALEAAILITLDPGAYTAIVTGVGGGTGVAIVEVFAAP